MPKTQIETKVKAQQIVLQLEAEFLKHCGLKPEELSARIPILDKSDITALIWNSMASDKIKSQMSYEIFSQVLEIFFNRLDEEKPFQHK